MGWGLDGKGPVGRGSGDRGEGGGTRWRVPGGRRGIDLGWFDLLGLFNMSGGTGAEVSICVGEASLCTYLRESWMLGI